ncbi:MAG: hypothetical protein EA403_15680 [Spirochaetaceae bacterium]|nr:MAG: hypothetical protein EA403_15680 [Spirochaetaceae bacterium]
MKPIHPARVTTRATRGASAGPVLAFIAVVVFATAGCTQLQDFATGVDITPPRFVGLEVLDEHTVEVLFDKPAEADHVGVSPSLGDLAITSTANRLVIVSEEATSIGAEYLLEGSVEDASGNSLRFLVRFYGHNPRLPRMLINELNPRGSGNNPESVELFAVTAGNLGGVTLSNGSPADWDSRMILPAVEIEEGDYVLVHFRPQGIPEEVDETTRRDESGGRNSRDTAWDFWVREGGGLPTNNGVITLSSRPGGPIMDAVLYTNRTSASDERYLGFGSTRMLERVRTVVDAGQWEIDGEHPRPEDLVDVTLSTATRSLNRSSDSRDTNSRHDWHVVPTRGLTFGAPNSDERHQP